MFFYPTRDVAMMVHGDDFIAIGCEKDLAETRRAPESKYKFKVEMLGSGKDEVTSVNILNKVITYAHNGVFLEADPRHSELVIKESNLETAKPGSVPGAKPTSEGT